MRMLSEKALEAMFAEETTEIVLFLLEIYLDDAGTNVMRFVSDTEALIHNGQQYVPYRFNISLPDEADKNRNEVELMIDNVDGNILAAVLDNVDTKKVIFKVVLKETPDVIEAGPFTFNLNRIRWNRKDITATLVVEELLTRAYPGWNVNPLTHPAVF